MNNRQNNLLILTILAVLMVAISSLLYVELAYGSSDEIVQESRWTIESEDGETVSQHDQQHTAIRNALALSRETGKTYYVTGNRIRINADRAEVELVDPVEPPAIDPVPEPAVPPVAGSEVVPGDSWGGPTATPAQIGSVTERAIAHWNVIPEQQVGDGFTVGVIAHHLDGIDRVEIAANGGAWVRAELGVNPRTSCEEYYAALSLDGSEGAIELRAIAYPNAGQPYVVRPMGSSYRDEDLTLYTYEVGAVLELPAGRHVLSPRDLPDEGWLTVRPAPGVDRDNVILHDRSRFWGSGRLKLENLTIEYPGGGGGVQGRERLDDRGRQIGNHLWLDQCVAVGSGPSGNTWASCFAWETASFTGCEFGRFQKLFFASDSIRNLIRNCEISEIYEDVFNAPGLMVNVTISDVDRQPVIDATGDRPHPDVWQYRLWEDTIVQDVTATDNVNAQGVFVQSGSVRDVAIVRARLSSSGGYTTFHPQVPISNMLVRDSDIAGRTDFSDASVSGRMVLRGNTDGDGREWTIGADGVEVYE